MGDGRGDQRGVGAFVEDIRADDQVETDQVGGILPPIDHPRGDAGQAVMLGVGGDEFERVGVIVGR